MARIDLTDFDRFRVEQARAVLAAVELLDLGDGRAMARMIGRLEFVLQQLLEVVDEAEGGAS
jgi:hypothetical protein